MIFLLKAWTSVGSLKARLRLANGTLASPWPPVVARAEVDTGACDTAGPGDCQPVKIRTVSTREQRWIDSTYTVFNIFNQQRIADNINQQELWFQPASICFFRPWTGNLTYTGRCNQCGCRKGRIYRYCSGILPKAIWYFGGKPTMLIYYILTNNLEILRIQKLSKPRLEFDHHPYASDKWTGDDNFCCLLHIMLSC